MEAFRVDGWVDALRWVFPEFRRALLARRPKPPKSANYRAPEIQGFRNQKFKVQKFKGSGIQGPEIQTRELQPKSASYSPNPRVTAHIRELQSSGNSRFGNSCLEFLNLEFLNLEFLNL